MLLTPRVVSNQEEATRLTDEVKRRMTNLFPLGTQPGPWSERFLKPPADRRSLPRPRRRAGPAAAAAARGAAVRAGRPLRGNIPGGIGATPPARTLPPSPQPPTSLLPPQQPTP